MHLVKSDSPLTKGSPASAETDEEEEITEKCEVKRGTPVHVGAGMDEDMPSTMKQSRSTRQVLRDVLDGVVDPDILDSCVEDLELITAHSGNKLCELVRATQQIRNARDVSEAVDSPTADIDAKGIACPSSSNLSTLFPTDGKCTQLLFAFLPIAIFCLFASL